jgi:hypothetical protein
MVREAPFLSMRRGTRRQWVNGGPVAMLLVALLLLLLALRPFLLLRLLLLPLGARLNPLGHSLPLITLALAASTRSLCV